MEMGNKIHGYAEDYLNNSKYIPLKSDKDIEGINPADIFAPLMKHLDLHVDNIQGLEKQLYSDK